MKQNKIQYQTIIKELKETNSDIDKFLKYFNVNKIEEITYSQSSKALIMLARKNTRLRMEKEQ